MLESFELNTFNYRLFILLAVIMIKLIITALVKHEPLRPFSLYCQLLSNKVCHPHSPSNQQALAGFIAIVVTLFPILLILWLFSAFIEVEYLWHGFLLYLSLGAFGLTTLSKNITNHLTLNQTYVAKQKLQPLLLRETEQLSSLGLSKACIEMVLLRTLQQAYVTAFVFMIAGPLAAIGYRLLLEMHYAWNTKLAQFIYFGRYSALLINLIQWLPTRLFSLLLLFMCIGKNFILFWRLSKPYFFQLTNNMPLLLLAFVLEIKLGGVAMYRSSNKQALGSNSLAQAKKLRKENFNDLARQPNPNDIVLANRKVKTLNIVTLFLLVVIVILNKLIKFNS